LEPAHAREVFAGRLIRVAVETWPTGVREIVHHPGACAVLALTAADKVVLVRQYREAVRESLLEIPAGVMDVQGEDGAGCAARELLEETGYRAAAPLEPLGWIFTSPGFADERIELFVARDVVPSEPGPRPDEDIEVVLLPLAEAARAIADGRIVDAKTIVALLL
jgi:ADP-ribose pyrophosphatase